MVSRSNRRSITRSSADAVVAEQFRRCHLSFAQQTGNRLVYRALRFLGVGTAGKGIVAVRPFRSITDRADLSGQSPLPDHSRGEVGGTGEVVRRAGRGLPEDDHFGRSSTQADGEGGGEVALGIKMALREGELLGYPECGTPRQDGDLGHGVRVLRERGDKGMAGFVHGDGVFLFGETRVRVVSPPDQEPVPSGAEVLWA